MTDLSIIIVSYNTRQLLADCLRSVYACSDEVSCEVIVVDNASTDGSCEMVDYDFPAAKLIRDTENRGFSTANNKGIRQSEGRYVMLLNSDTIVHRGAFRGLVSFMDAHPHVGYCGPKLLNADGTHQPSARRFPTIRSRAWSMIGRDGRHPDSIYAMDLHACYGHGESFRAGWLTGACLVVRRQVIDLVGLLDEKYFLYFEETDWCRRMASAGYQGWYVASATVTHFGGQSVVHTAETRPFSGNHPVHWVHSCRRYQRQHFGLMGMISAQAMELCCYALIWLRHVWRRNDRSRDKAHRSFSNATHDGVVECQ